MKFNNSCMSCGKELKRGETQVLVGEVSGVPSMVIGNNLGGMKIPTIKWYCVSCAKIEIPKIRDLTSL